MQLKEVLINPISEDDEYLEFLDWANSIPEGRIDEGLIPNSLKKKFQFIKSLAVGMRVKIKDLITFFKNSKIFKFFKSIGFQMAKLHRMLKKGFKVYQDFLTAVGDFIAKTPAGQWTEKKLKQLDEFFKTHPKTKRVAGLVVAALLVYIWFNMTFTGDPAFDFGMDDLLAALAGKFKLSIAMSLLHQSAVEWCCTSCRAEPRPERSCLGRKERVSTSVLIPSYLFPEGRSRRRRYRECKEIEEHLLLQFCFERKRSR